LSHVKDEGPSLLQFSPHSRQRGSVIAPVAKSQLPRLLGVAMGIAGRRFGRARATIVASPGIADLDAWLKQLTLAGKQAPLFALSHRDRDRSGLQCVRFGAWFGATGHGALISIKPGRESMK